MVGLHDVGHAALAGLELTGSRPRLGAPDIAGSIGQYGTCQSMSSTSASAAARNLIASGPCCWRLVAAESKNAVYTQNRRVGVR